MKKKSLDSLGFFSKYVIARKRNVSFKMLEMLSKDKNEKIRYLVACNNKTPCHILKRLFKDKFEFVRDAVLNNPNCPEIIKLLYK